MTTQLLATELANLIQESKRKHNDLRQAAEKSLEELKQIGSISEQAVPHELSQKVNFVNPFIIACGTKNAKFTGIAIVCLQRLIASRALPSSRLSQVLEALMQASSAGLDVQLKILQALPSLLQNYAADIKGELLMTALNVCIVLQSSKNAIVNNTSAATLQQLIVSVFDKVVAEDKNGDAPLAGEAPTMDGKVELRSAALDAYRIFHDLCLMTENQRPEFLRFSGLPQTFGLELIESVITNHAAVFTSHPEQAYILRSRVMPLLISALKDRPSFSKSVRLVRILYTILRRHIGILPAECGDALDLLTQLLDHDQTIWRRALCMEVFRGIFAEYALVRRLFATYDAQENQKNILKDLVAAFVRLSTEKPSVIGLGHQSSLPITNVTSTPNASADQAMLEASSVTGIISTSVGTESSNIGISTQWSFIRVPCIDQLDKTEPPPIPESYIYSLVLSCISSLSDGLAKFILPLTVPGESRSRKKASKQDEASQQEGDSAQGLERSTSFKKNPVPLNPLALEDHQLYPDIKTCAAIIEECWPAILATCSTFLYAALDSEFYHGLVRAFQRFAHVAGLLQLHTPRDAFLTTLGKTAVPSNVLTACLNAGQSRPATPSTSEAPNSIFSNARNLLSVENLTQTPSEKQKRVSTEVLLMSLNTRNLLCLRALLNLGIALGPTLGPAWKIVWETLQQADFVLFVTGKSGRTSSVTRQEAADGDSSSLMANFGNEVRSVETAAARLAESTIDFPNEPFVEVIEATCGLLSRRPTEKEAAGMPPSPASAPGKSPRTHRRMTSFPNQASSGFSNQEYQFALAKLGEIALINMERLLRYSPETSGWSLLIDELINALVSGSMSAPVRMRAAEILTRLMLEAASAASNMSEESREPIQLRFLGALRSALLPLLEDGRDAVAAAAAIDADIHKILLDGLKDIIENCGQSLVSGWDITFEIIGSIFVMKRPGGDRRGSVVSTASLTTRSSKLIRSSFSSLQLICSDFLATLPNSCFLILVDTLYKFCSQDDELNIALTTVTFFWVLSDFLSGREGSLDITAELVKGADISDLERMAADRGQQGSDAALWMLLLLRLTNVASDGRLELRNSAIQTLLRIFDAYGDRLNPESWSICTKSVVFKLLSSLEEILEAATRDGVDQVVREEWNGTAVVVVNGISGLIANYLDVLTLHPSFSHLWRELLGHFASLLELDVMEINTAAFKALGHILSQTSTDGKPIFSDSAVKIAWNLWSGWTPSPDLSKSKTDDNQNCLIAYVSAFHQVYTLLRDDLNVDRVDLMLRRLRAAVEEASIGAYVQDVEYLTPLQSQVLEAIQMIRTDVDGVPSSLVMQLSGFVALAYDQNLFNKSGPKRTYIAMSKASMKLLQDLILKHASHSDIYQSRAFAAALSALREPVVLKYQFPTPTKSTQPWRLATSTVLAILEATLPNLGQLELPSDTIQDIWSNVVAIAAGIMSATCDDASDGPDFGDDENFDIESFRRLRELIVPAIGSGVVTEDTRKAYTESLFKTSIIHEVAPLEKIILDKGDASEVSTLFQPRHGRTVAVPPTARSQMAYVTLDELFSLVSTEQGTVVVVPPTPMTTVFKESSQPSEPLGQMQARIARVAAPLLVLRCALTLRAYVSDQPLRGLMPQPLSQRKELTWILERLVKLKSDGQAISGLDGVSETRKHLFRLYPLMVKALPVRGDSRVLTLIREALDVVGTEMGLSGAQTSVDVPMLTLANKILALGGILSLPHPSNIMGKSSKDKRDAYYRLAKEQGWRARSAFKLLQLDEEFDLFANVSRVVDLCAAPGSWSQVLSRVLIKGEKFGRVAWQDREAKFRQQMLGVFPDALSDEQQKQVDDAVAKQHADSKPREDVKIVSIDLQPISPLAGITTLRADITHPATVPLLLSSLDPAYDPSTASGTQASHPVDLVLSDGAPDVTGLHDLDIYVQSQLLYAALNLALCVLKPGGKFVAKIFRGRNVDILYAQLKIFFEKVIVAKPRSSRASSVEAFIVCLNFRPPPGFQASLEEPLGVGSRLKKMAEERAMQMPIVAEALMQDEGSSAWSCGAAPAPVPAASGVTEMEVYDETGDSGGKSHRWVAPFIACGDLSSFDSDASYELPEDHVSLDPVQPPIAPPYKRALEMRAAMSGAAR
ncbi:FtsJ-like methyltransferase-domain-containing protein [Stachybotrys elegans]|uniref:Putative tRNA (cytidine(32)/guanosine(34)-2'-O)-methyltransferase n=1 Tax=Stachybotrys elegans TaxID=80388 RepID=A0A8K0SQA0_9HYPO|nr:FtsJ-like methyltransferase-domain-containing protein [Stachybotrys elegans]